MLDGSRKLPIRMVESPLFRSTTPDIWYVSSLLLFGEAELMVQVPHDDPVGALTMFTRWLKNQPMA
jgi:hypothetical protein